MKPEMYETMGARLIFVRETLDRLGRLHNPATWPDATSLEARLVEEEKGLVDALVGDDPLALASIAHLREKYADNDLAIQDEDGPAIRLGGNEHWIFADVQIGDDYGAFDFAQKYAIWRNTGALYRVLIDGAAADDPLFVPVGSPYTGPVESL